MHADIAFSCNLVRMLHKDRPTGTVPLPRYVASLTFAPLPSDPTSQPWPAPLTGVADWCQWLAEHQVQQVLLMLPVGATASHSSATNIRRGVYTRFANRSSLWQASWKYDDVAKSWHIHYLEMLWQPAAELYDYYDNRLALVDTLTQLAALASTIGEPNFARIFQGALQILRQENSGAAGREALVKAADKAWVFGGMGSWNDSAPWYAEQKGLGDEYHRLTDALYQHLQIALMFAANGRDDDFPGTA